MCPTGRHVYSLALVAVLLAGAGTPFVRGEDDDDDLAGAHPEQKAPRGFRAGGRIMISERNIDAWVYGNESRGREWLEASLRQKVDELARTCELSEVQKQKLNLAGEGDITRFESRLDELKAKCQEGALPRDQWNDIIQKTQPLRAELQRGLFGSGSLYWKTFSTVLRPEQAERWAQADRERRAYRYRARVELCVAQLDAVVGLRDEQRQRLVQLILDKTHPPRNFGQNDRFLVLVQMSRIPEEALKSVLDPIQWREVRRRLTNARQMKQLLKQNGVVFEEDLDLGKEDEYRPLRLRVEAENGRAVFVAPAR